ncbi:helix-turn-helix domain-containing protein [Rhodobacteraceae bacterium NNCM2]|nr:helix-turn-helix domain-containing protein [Coraliihabitans acroporae]
MPDVGLEEQLLNISRLARVIDASQNADETYQLLTKGVCAHSKWDISGIQVLDPDSSLAIPIVRHDPFFGGDLSKVAGWDARISPVSRVLEQDEPLIIPDMAAQDDFPAFRDDAQQRGYHTVVMIPLDVRDAAQRRMVYSVASRQIVDVSAIDLAFLQCVAELTNIAMLKMRKLEKERRQARRLKRILANMTASLSKTLESEATDTLAEGLSSLFPAGWLAVDLTSGRGLFDPDAPPPVPLQSARRLPDDLIRAAIRAQDHPSEELTTLLIDGAQVRAEVSALQIDGNHVGALFFFRNAALSDHERIAAQAGRLALSSFILRSFIEFRSRRTTARRLLSRLLSGDWKDPGEIQDEAHALDFDLQTAMRLVMIRLPDATAVDEGEHSYIQRSAQAVFGSVISCFLEGDLILLLSDEKDRAPAQKATFLSRVRSVMPADVALVMSERVDDAEGLVAARQTCANTLAVARSMNKTGWIGAVNVGDFPVLMASADVSMIKGYLDNVLPEGLAGASRKAQVARETVEVFLQAGRRYQEAAETLGIHVTTLRYRIDQLRDQHGITFDDPDKCFEIDLALRLSKLKSSYDS